MDHGRGVFSVMDVCCPSVHVLNCTPSVLAPFHTHSDFKRNVKEAIAIHKKKLALNRDRGH